MLFRILTEDKNRDVIESMVAAEFPGGFTVIPATGYWKPIGMPTQSEQSLVIEIYGNPYKIRDAVYSLAGRIKRHNDQDCVLVQEVQCTGTFV